MKKYYALLLFVIAIVAFPLVSVGGGKGLANLLGKFDSNDAISKFACYSPKLNSETIKLPRFSSIVSDNCADIFFIQSDKEYSITVEGNVSQPLKRVNYKVDGEVLRLSINADSENVLRDKNRTIYVDSFLKIYIKAPSLSYVCVGGTSDFSSERLVQSSGLSLDMRGTGDFSFTWIKLPGMKLNSSGTGDLSCDGAAIRECELNLLGTGDIYFKSLNSTKVQMYLGGTGDFRMPTVIADNIFATLNGTGDIALGGVCRNKASLAVAGTGDLVAVNLWAKIVSANISGTGSLSCAPVETLVASRSYGTLIYYGNPTNVNTSGKVIHKKK